jgi:hypothetical protein
MDAQAVSLQSRNQLGTLSILREATMRHKSRVFAAGAAAWVAACAWPQACGAQYSWQLSSDYQQYEIGEFIDVATTHLEATYHFRPIDVERLGGPYSLAGFLDRSSRMTAGLRRERSKSFPSSISTDGYSLSGRYVWREAGWFLGGRTEQRETDLPSPTFMEQTLKAEGYGLSAGKYLAESTAVELTLESEVARWRGHQLAPCVFMCSLESRDRAEVVGLSVMHVGTLRQMGYAASASARHRSVRTRFPEAAPLPPDISPDDIIQIQFPEVRSSRIYSASGQLFPTTRLGIGVGYSRWSRDRHGVEDYTYDVSTVWFFRPNVAAQIGWSRTRMDLLLPDWRRADTASVRLLGRF